MPQNTSFKAPLAWWILSVCTQSWSSQVRGAPFYTTFLGLGIWDNTRGAQIEVLTKVAQKYKLEPTLGPGLKCLHWLGFFSFSYADACPPHLHRIALASLLLYIACALMHRSCTSTTAQNLTSTTLNHSFDSFARISVHSNLSSASRLVPNQMDAIMMILWCDRSDLNQGQPRASTWCST